MEQIPNQAERVSEIQKDTELTARLLGALGLVDASLYEYDNPSHIDQAWTRPVEVVEN